MKNCSELKLTYCYFMIYTFSFATTLIQRTTLLNMQQTEVRSGLDNVAGKSGADELN